MEIRIEPLKGEEETERGEYKKASKDSLFKRRAKGGDRHEHSIFPHVLRILLPGSGFPEFLILSHLGPEGVCGEGEAAELLLQATQMVPVWGCGDIPPRWHLWRCAGPNHGAKRQIKAAAPQEGSAWLAHTYQMPAGPWFSQKPFAATTEEGEGIEVSCAWNSRAPYSGPHL